MDEGQEAIWERELKRLAAMLANMDGTGIEQVSISIVYTSGHVSSQTVHVSKPEEE